MAVPADPVNDHAQPATTRMVDMRAGGVVSGGSHLYEGERLVTGWHHHDLHQIEYAVQGMVEVETSAGKYLLPPHQAAWIPAGCSHTATLHSATRTIAVLFAPELVPVAGDRVRILAVPPLIREMMLPALRWPITRAASDPASDGVADTFFRTLGHLVAETLDHESPLSLPTSTDPIVIEAIDYTQAHLSSVTAAEVSKAIGVSERTMRRRFENSLTISWRTYLLHARLLRAMALLTESKPSVLDVSLAVGFEDASAFARAFVQHCGETPSAYRRRALERSG